MEIIEWLQTSDNILLFTVLISLIIVIVLILSKISESHYEALEKEKGGKHVRVKKTLMSTNSKMFNVKNAQWFLFGFIMLVAIFVRVWKFGEVPAGVNQDGAMGAVDALALSQYGTDRFGMWMPAHFTAWGTGQMSVLLSYLMVPFIKIFGFSIITIRLPILLASLAAIYVLFAFGKKAVDTNFGLIIMGVVALNPWQIMQSRWAIDCNLFPHFVLFGAYFLYLGLSKKRYMYISMLFFGLSMYCYGIALYTVPIFLAAIYIFLLVRKRINIKQILISAAAFLLVSGPFITVMIINILKLKTIATPIMTLPFFPDSKRSADIIFFSPDKLGQLIQNVLSFFSYTFLQLDDGNIWNALPGFSTLYFSTIPLLLFGMVMLAIHTFKNKKGISIDKAEPEKRFGLAIIFAFMFAALACGLITNNVNINRINIAYYPLMIFISYGIYVLFQKNKISLLAIALIILLLFSSFTVNYFAPNQKVEKAFYSGFGQAMDVVQDLKYDRIYITVNSQFQATKEVSEILAMFYHEMDAEYFQGKRILKNKDGTEKLPYKERYKYIYFDTTNNSTYIYHDGKYEDISDNYTQSKFNPGENAVYVVNNSDLPFFTNQYDSSKFVIKEFEFYSAVIPAVVAKQLK
ncbi:MAG: glycosyltransferase family 39 protein [Bacillota bacterium]